MKVKNIDLFGRTNVGNNFRIYFDASGHCKS
jgi:hypothetical protein